MNTRLLCQRARWRKLLIAVTLSMYVDVDRWREHHATVARQFPTLVPVMCGNGYGFGLEWLAEEVARLGADAVAVGTVYEAARVKNVFDGSVLVLAPFQEGEERLSLPLRVIRSVSSVRGLRSLSGRRVVVQVKTRAGMGGVTPEDLQQVRSALADVYFEGFLLHLPKKRRTGYEAVEEVSAWIDDLRRAGLALSTLYISHLTADELASMRRDHPRTRFRACLGRRLWLGEPGAVVYRATVLRVASTARGDRFGLLQRQTPVDGSLIMVAGGTANGVGLEPIETLEGALPRVKEAAYSSLMLINRVLSPFEWAGRRRWFAEPPDQQASVLFLPAGVPAPRAGSELRAYLASTLTHADRVVFR